MKISKKGAASKRAKLPRASDYTKEFLKDWIRLSHAGRYDLSRLKQVMLLIIANDEPLGPEWSDHQLVGAWEGHRECHVGGDFLLVYRLVDDKRSGSVVFVRAGSHSDLFA